MGIEVVQECSSSDEVTKRKCYVNFETSNASSDVVDEMILLRLHGCDDGQ